jgi:TRAP-type mannitol/chloroaromatic compound transport system substrate-binding protein
MKRRDFLKKAATGAVAQQRLACNDGECPGGHCRKKYNWKMVTTWPPNLPVLQTGVNGFAKRVEELPTGGQLKIQVFAGGELVPPLGSFHAVSDGTVEVRQRRLLLLGGQGAGRPVVCGRALRLEPPGHQRLVPQRRRTEALGRSLCPLQPDPRPQGNTGVQMGGWFRKNMNTIDDYKGSKCVSLAWAARSSAKAGGTVVLLPGGEIFTSLERGVIDATEWVGPMHDLRMGFYKAAKYYYYPGWHEPGTCLEVMFNKKGLRERCPRIFSTSSMRPASRPSTGCWPSSTPLMGDQRQEGGADSIPRSGAGRSA